MRMLWTIPPMIVVIIWGISHFYEIGYDGTIFYRQIWIESSSGDFRFEYCETKQDRFFETVPDPGTGVIDNRSLLESLRGSGFLFKKVRISRGWIQMFRAPYWALFAFTFIGTVSLYVANRVGTRVSPASPTIKPTGQ